MGEPAVGAAAGGGASPIFGMCWVTVVTGQRAGCRHHDGREAAACDGALGRAGAGGRADCSRVHQDWLGPGEATHVHVGTKVGGAHSKDLISTGARCGGDIRRVWCSASCAAVHSCYGSIGPTSMDVAFACVRTVPTSVTLCDGMRGLSIVVRCGACPAGAGSCGAELALTVYLHCNCF